MAEACDSSDDEEIIMICAAAVAITEQQQPTRTVWTRDWLLRRPTFGAYSQLLQELIREDAKEARRFLRMSFENFQEILHKVEHRIKKQDTNMRKAIEPGERLAITMRFLGSGDSFANLAYTFRVADNTIGRIVLETCDALYEQLRDECLKIPSTPQEWERISADFDRRWQFPNCIGALDGKHIAIESPGRGSEYFNYKHFHSIVLLALVDANYKIIWFDAGGNGRAGDAGLFRETDLAAGLEGNKLGIPSPKALPGRRDPVPYFIVGDDAFGLKPYLMKPYPGRLMTTGRSDDPREVERRKQRIFDYRLSRARRLSENVFGILAARFGVFRRAMRTSPENARTITLACLVLHNFLMGKKDPQFAPSTFLDREHPITHAVEAGTWRASEGQNCFGHISQQDGNRNAEDARWVRDEVKEYVNAEGMVHWQQHLVFGRDLI